MPIFVLRAEMDRFGLEKRTKHKTVDTSSMPCNQMYGLGLTPALAPPKAGVKSSDTIGRGSTFGASAKAMDQTQTPTRRWTPCTRGPNSDPNPAPPPPNICRTHKKTPPTLLGSARRTPMTKGMGAEAYSSMSVGRRGMKTCCQAKGYRMAMAAWTQLDRVSTSSATRTVRRSHRMADHRRRKLRGPSRT